MLRQSSALISKRTVDLRCYYAQWAALGAILAFVFLCMTAFISDDFSDLGGFIQPSTRNRDLLLWNDYEDIPPFRGDVPVFHDGWKQRSLDFDKRDMELEKDPKAPFDGEKFIHDNLNNAGPHSDATNDNTFSWVKPSGFDDGHWDYDRVTFGMKEKPLDHKKGTVCDPEQSGPDVELCTPLCDPILGCYPPINENGQFADGDNLDSKKGGSQGLLKNMNGWTGVKD